MKVRPKSASEKKSRIRIAAVAAACGALIIIAGAHLGAQEHAGTQSTPDLARKLQDERVLFRAMIEREPDVTAQDIENGRLVAVGGSQQGSTNPACIQCHGANGSGDSAAGFPRLAGLPAWYMYKQLLNYADGSRPNNVMTPIAQNMTDAEMRSVSKYYAVVEAPYPPVEEAVDQLLIQWGGQLAAVGSVEKAIPACTNCHGAQGFGVPPSVPYIAGQHQAYMELQLQLWKKGERRNDPLNVMAAIAQKMNDEDIRAVSAYYARIRPYEERVAQVEAQSSGQPGAMSRRQAASEPAESSAMGQADIPRPDTTAQARDTAQE